MKFSVVTLSYNQRHFVRQAIESVLGQAGVSLEYIVVDPGSSDGSREVIRRYESALSAVIFEPDSGPAMGLNKGLARATGEIFYYLNADDYLLPGAFQRVQRLFQRCDADVICGGGFIVDATGRPLQLIRSDPFGLKRYAYGAAFVLQQGTFIRRAAMQRIAGFNVNNRTCWDAELVVDLALSGATVVASRDLYGCFRIHPESITGSDRAKTQYLSDRSRLFQKIRKRPEHWLDRLAMQFARLWRFANNPATALDKLTMGRKLENLYRLATSSPEAKL